MRQMRVTRDLRDLRKLWEDVAIPPTYTLSDLEKAVKLTWREFAEWADVRLPHTVGRYSNPKLGRFHHGYHSPCNVLASHANRQFCRDWRELMCMLFVEVIAECPAIKEWYKFEQIALGKYSDQDGAWEIFWSRRKRIDDALKAVLSWKTKGKVLPKKIRPYVRDCLEKDIRELRWYRYAIRGPFNHEMAFWAQVQDGLKDDLGIFSNMSRKIDSATLLSPDELDTLTRYCLNGSVKPVFSLEANGTTSLTVRMDALWVNIHACEVKQHVIALLVPIAYQLSVALEESQPWPRFIIACRNPACGKKFYSALPNAVACPRHKGDLGPSKCKRGWDSYSKWLKNICEAEGTDPEKVWDEPQRKKEFLKTWRPRRPQSPYS